MDTRTDSKGRKQPAKRKTEQKQTSRLLKSIIKDIKDNLAEEDVAIRAAFAAGYDPNVVPEEETEQDWLIRQIHQDQHAWLGANPGKTLCDDFWFSRAAHRWSARLRTPPHVADDADAAADDTEASAAVMARRERALPNGRPQSAMRGSAIILARRSPITRSPAHAATQLKASAPIANGLTNGTHARAMRYIVGCRDSLQRCRLIPLRRARRTKPISFIARSSGSLITSSRSSRSGSPRTKRSLNRKLRAAYTTCSC